MDQSVVIQEALSAGETCLAAVQGILAGEEGVESRLLGLVESHGKFMICLYTHRRMAITAEDVCLERILLIQDEFAIEEVPQECDLHVIGSDVTVHITCRDANLLVQLPFGSQTQTFLQEVQKCCSPADFMAPVNMLLVNPEEPAPSPLEQENGFSADL